MKPKERVRRPAKARSPSGSTPQHQTRKAMTKKPAARKPAEEKKQPATKKKSYVQAAGPVVKGKTKWEERQRMPFDQWHDLEIRDSTKAKTLDKKLNDLDDDTLLHICAGVVGMESFQHVITCVDLARVIAEERKLGHFALETAAEDAEAEMEVNLVSSKKKRAQRGKKVAAAVATKKKLHADFDEAEAEATEESESDEEAEAESRKRKHKPATEKDRRSKFHRKEMAEAEKAAIYELVRKEGISARPDLRTSVPPNKKKMRHKNKRRTPPARYPSSSDSEELDSEEESDEEEVARRRRQIKLAVKGKVKFNKVMGINAVPDQMRSSETEKTLRELRMATSGNALHMAVPFQLFVLSSGVALPMAAPKADKNLTKTPPQARYFEVNGAAEARKPTASTVSCEGTQLMLHEEDVKAKSQHRTVRKFAFLEAVRLNWMVHIVGPQHPAFLTESETYPAINYVLWLQTVEFELTYGAIEMMDTHLMNNLFHKTWRFSDNIPHHQLVNYVERKPVNLIHCVVCGETGHGMYECAAVTGISRQSKNKRVKDKDRDRDRGNGRDGGRDRDQGRKKKKGYCHAFNRGEECSYGEKKCRFHHKCEKCDKSDCKNPGSC